MVVEDGAAERSHEEIVGSVYFSANFHIACFDPSHRLITRAPEALSRKPGNAGAIAFSRTGDPSSGDFGDAKLIRRFGDVPDDLSTL
ncbi:hypothetical protein ACVWYH_007859 [Bradyrhizobium sp. GM24.11]